MTTGPEPATPDSGVDDLVPVDGRTVVARVEMRLSLIDLAEIMGSWVSGQAPRDVDAPTSTTQAADIVTGVLFHWGELWTDWRSANDFDHDYDEVTRTVYSWADTFFGGLFDDRSREALARHLAMQVPAGPAAAA